MQDKIIVTGAGGRLGRVVMALIPGAIALVRTPCGFENERAVDYADKDALSNALADCSVLVHLAGSMDFGSRAALEEGNVALTEKILAMIPSETRVVYASSISVYGKKVSGTINEETLVEPDSDYARTKYDAEKLVLTRKDAVALRIGPIYGPGYPDYGKFLRMIKKGKMVVIGDGRNNVPFVHVEDVAKAVAASCTRGEGRYILAGAGASQEEIYRLAAKELGVAPPRRHVPKGIALFFARLSMAFAKISGKKAMITTEHVNILASDRNFDCSKAEKELGFASRSIASGIKEMVATIGNAEPK